MQTKSLLALCQRQERFLKKKRQMMSWSAFRWLDLVPKLISGRKYWIKENFQFSRPNRKGRTPFDNSLTDQLAGHGEAIEGRRGGIQPTELGGDIIAAIRAKFPQHQYEKTTRLLL